MAEANQDPKPKNLKPRVPHNKGYKLPPDEINPQTNQIPNTIPGTDVPYTSEKTGNSGQRSQNGLRGRLFAEAETLTEEEAVAMIPVKQREFLQRYVELDSAKQAYIEVYQPKNPDKVSNQPHRILEQPKNAAYVKMVRLRAANHSILSLEELARWLSTQILNTKINPSEQLKAADTLIKLAGWNTPVQTEAIGSVTHEVVLSLATPPGHIEADIIPTETSDG